MQLVVGEYYRNASGLKVYIGSQTIGGLFVGTTHSGNSATTKYYIGSGICTSGNTSDSILSLWEDDSVSTLAGDDGEDNDVTEFYEESSGVQSLSSLLLHGTPLIQPAVDNSPQPMYTLSSNEEEDMKVYEYEGVQYLRFGDLSYEDKLDLIKHHLIGGTLARGLYDMFSEQEGDSIQITSWSNLIFTSGLALHPNHVYKKSDVGAADIVDWTVLPREYKYLARDTSGEAHVYCTEPDWYPDTGMWDEDSSLIDDCEDYRHPLEVSPLGIYKKGTLDPMFALAKRPRGL